MFRLFLRFLPASLLASLLMVGEVLADLLQPKFMSSVVDEGILGRGQAAGVNLDLIVHYSVIMLAVVAAGGFFGCACNYFVQYAAQSFGNAVRKKAFGHIMTLSFPEVDSLGSGTLITRITNDVSNIERLVMMLSRGLVRTLIMLLGSIVFMFTLSPDFGLLILASLPVIATVLFLCMLRANPLFLRLQGELDAINSLIGEDLNGLRVIKAFVREVFELFRFKNRSLKLMFTQLRILYFFAFMDPFVNILLNLLVALLLLEGGARVTDGTATPGAVMAAITYVTMLIHSVMMLMFLTQNLSRGMISWRRLTELLDKSPSVKDGPKTLMAPEAPEIRFDNVSFTYPGTVTPVLSDVSFTVKKGSFVAVLGATGSGKTTLLNLIARFYDPTKGRVLFDDQDIADFTLSSLSASVSMAAQKSEIFQKSIYDNIAMGLNGKNDPDAREKVHKAAGIAQALEFIETRPNGFEAEVSELGTSLSGGQRQRLSIARALARQAKVLLFDDATSALDFKTERKLLTALRKNRQDATLIMVAQRIATVRQADSIIVLDKGRICAQGTHAELIKSCPLYLEICRSQLSEEELAGGLNG